MRWGDAKLNIRKPVTRRPVTRRPVTWKAAITLVELMVSLVIVGILIIGVFLPVLVSSQEMSRRALCAHNLSQVARGVLNLENAQRVFPSGGIHPSPDIRNYASIDVDSPNFTGVAHGPEKQGLGWMYQILPYLPGNARPGPVTQKEIDALDLEVYFCPARRPPTRSSRGHLLNDFVGMSAAPSRGQVGGTFFDSLLTAGCRTSYSFWGTTSYSNDKQPISADQLGSRYTGFWGVIVRSSYLRKRNGEVRDLKYTPLTRLKSISDGTSHTGMITEKALLEPCGAGDERGWSDGWAPDTMRLTLCQPVSDQEQAVSAPNPMFSAGSAHSSGLHVAMADGSVRFTNFRVDLETWNRTAHRSDGEFISFGALSGP